MKNQKFMLRSNIIISTSIDKTYFWIYALGSGGKMDSLRTTIKKFLAKNSLFLVGDLSADGIIENLYHGKIYVVDCPLEPCHCEVVVSDIELEFYIKTPTEVIKKDLSSKWINYLFNNSIDYCQLNEFIY